MENIAFELRAKLPAAVQRNKASALLFSGGLDSAILARINSNIKAVTVSLNSEGEDVRHATSLARLLKIEHFHKKVSVDEAEEAIPEVIKILKTFDPAIPNDLTVYFGLKKAKELGIKNIMTGDGSDELFAGYDFMQKIGDLEVYTEKITRRIKFSSNKLGRFFKIKIVQPFLDKEFIDFSLGIGPEFKIKKQNGKVWGKWILRKTFQDFLPKEIIWQSKRPLEYGSGMNRLRDIITSRISDKEFKQKSRFYPIKFMNKEHLYYYQIYKDVIGPIPQAKKGQKQCPGCSAGMSRRAFHCPLCGWVEPIK